MTTRRALGAMTGTSLDGLDTAVVELAGRGLDLRATFVRHEATPFPVDLARRLRRLADQTPVPAAECAALARDFGHFHADALARLARGAAIDFAGVHGQTVAHGARATWQLVDPAPIARALACPVVHDLRRADMAAGGRGAPLTPLADWLMYRDCAGPQAIVNLGGFVNVTRLPARDDRRGIDAIAGFDACAGNQVLDAVARAALDAPYDRGGAAALAGCVVPAVRDELIEQLEAQRRAGRALGTGDELIAWVDRNAGQSPTDLAASAVAAVATVAARAIGSAASLERIVLAGGGTRHAALVRAIDAEADAPVVIDGPLPAPAREAVAMAILGALALDGVPISLPQVTGCARPAPRGGVVCPAP